jgi:hypothetical protein
MKRNYWIVSAILALIVSSMTLMQGTGSQAADEDAARKIETLMKLRLEVLEELVQATTAFYQGGRGSLEDVLQASVLQSQAELELAKDASARRDILARRLEKLRELETVTKERFESGVVDVATSLRARAERLAAEIALQKWQAGNP